MIRWTLVLMLICLAGCAGDASMHEGADGKPPAPLDDRMDDFEAETEADITIDVIAFATDLDLSRADRARFVLTPVEDRGDLLTALEAVRGGAQLFLILRGLSADEPPGVVYTLFLNLPAGEEPDPESPHHVGSINFYGAVPAKPGFYSFDISRQVKSLAERGQLETPSTITVVPRGTPAAGAAPSIRRAELVLEPMSDS